MSLYIDVKYVGFIASRLRNFKKRDTNLWNFSCPICNDSATVKKKARGYIYCREQKLNMMCHNCGYSHAFGVFLEQVDKSLYAEYRMEKWRDKNEGSTRREKPKVEVEKVEEANLFKTDVEGRLKRVARKVPTSLLDGLLDRLDTLDDDHEAVVYARDRGIPETSFAKMYFIPSVCDIVQLSAKYKDRIKTKEPRIVLPFYTMSGQLSGVTCRAIRGESLRYIMVKVKEEESLIFGINDIDRDKRIYCTEGPIDSLFLPNAIAVGGSAMGKLAEFGLPKDKLVVIFDNQPRNREICAIIEKNIDAGHQVVIWNSRNTHKDINDMALAGVDYMREIETRVFSGLAAKMEFNKWKKC